MANKELISKTDDKSLNKKFTNEKVKKETSITTIYF